MISINLLDHQLLYQSSIREAQYIIVNMMRKGSLLCPLCEEMRDGLPTSDCIHIRRVPIVPLADRLSR